MKGNKRKGSRNNKYTDSTKINTKCIQSNGNIVVARKLTPNVEYIMVKINSNINKFLSKKKKLNESKKRIFQYL